MNTFEFPVASRQTVAQVNKHAGLVTLKIRKMILPDWSKSAIASDVHPKSKNKSAVKALYLLAFTPNSKLFSSDYPYVPAWQYFWQLYL